MPDYVLWVFACDYHIHEENDENEDEDDKQKREQIKRSFRIISQSKRRIRNNKI
jgi:hypothetical protein